MKKALYKEIATLINARNNCLQNNNNDWLVKREQKLERIAKNLLPSGSGFDCGTKIDIDKSKDDKIILTTSYHHMNDVGMYDGWNDYVITLKPSLVFDFELKIKGVNRNDIKNYMYEYFQDVLSQEIETDNL